MKRILVIGLVFLLLTGLGAAKGLSDIRSGQSQEVTDAPVSQHDEFDTEEKMQERSVKGGTISNGVLAGVIEKDQVKRGMVVAKFVKDGQLDDRKQVNLKIDDIGFPGSQSIISGKSVEQDEYREGNDAEYEKKSWGQPSFDDLEMERGVKPGDTKLHDWFEDVRAGSADAARKEISVKMQKENEWREGAQKVIIRLAKGDEKRVGEKVSAISKHSARKGRNPQTGKEIKIPARSGYDYEGREPEEKEVEMVISETVKEKPQQGKVVAIHEKESGEEYFVHATGLIDEIRDEDDVSFEIREGRKGMNAVDVRRTD